MKVSTKVAVVTGATSGIGKEVACQLAREGWTVVLACRNVESASKVSNWIMEQCARAKVEVGPALNLTHCASIREFAKQMGSRPINLLVNNAGINYVNEFYSDEGVAGLCQVNYVGPFLLTRLLVPNLLQSPPSRVVNLSSVMHRLGKIDDINAFFHDWYHGGYKSAKFANAMMTIEFQRRLGSRGVSFCSVDPGGVNTSIYNGSMFAYPPMKWFLDGCYAPPKDAAQSVLHACRFPEDRDSRKAQAEMKKIDYEYYARGLFATRFITCFKGRGYSSLSHVTWMLWGLSTLMHSLLDYPIRHFSGHRFQTKTRRIEALCSAYDENMAREMWNATSKLVGIPENM